MEVYIIGIIKSKEGIPKSDFDVNKNNNLMSFDFRNDNNSNTTADIINNNSVIVNSPPDNLQSKNEYLSPSTTSQPLFDNKTTPIANASAPAIDGEPPDVKRTYNLRASTVRKINELKSIHPNINVCVSTIVDVALEYYHEYITSGEGSQ